MRANHSIILISHQRPKQLSKLIESLSYDKFDIYIHLDAGEKDKFRDFEYSRKERVKKVISKYDIKWGGFRIIRAILELIKLAKKKGYDTYSLLSGVSYPLKSNKYIDRCLSSKNVSRIEYWHKDEDRPRRDRYTRYYFYDWPSPWGRICNSVSRRLSPFLPDRSMPSGIKPYYGSGWWTLTDKAVQAVLRFIEGRPDFLRFMKYVSIPHEMFFQTAILNSNFDLNISKKTLRYIDWSNGGAHPKTLRFDDLPSLKNTKCLFGRKFNERRFPGMIERVESIRENNDLDVG